MTDSSQRAELIRRLQEVAARRDKYPEQFGPGISNLLKEAATALEGEQVPVGWKLVRTDEPVTSNAMIAAGLEAWRDWTKTTEHESELVKRIYRAMLSSAPASPEVPVTKMLLTEMEKIAREVAQADAEKYKRLTDKFPDKRPEWYGPEWVAEQEIENMRALSRANQILHQSGLTVVPASPVREREERQCIIDYIRDIVAKHPRTSAVSVLAALEHAALKDSHHDT